MNVQDLCAVLDLLKAESQALHETGTEQEWHKLMEKYDMIFCGEKTNVIYSADLCHMLRNKRGIEISIDELHSLLPAAAKQSGMKLSPMVRVEDAGDPGAPIANYSIQLY